MEKSHSDEGSASLSFLIKPIGGTKNKGAAAGSRGGGGGHDTHCQGLLH